MKKVIIENLKTLFFALIIAIIIRSLFFQPFYIPSSSMEPNLLVGDRFFASKYSYGYSRHSFPFSPNIYFEKILKTDPKRGDVIVFKTNYKNDDFFVVRIICNFFNTCRTDYIKRLIGLPGDKINFIKGDLYINESKISKTLIKKIKYNCGDEECLLYNEELPGGFIHKTIYKKSNSYDATIEFNVPKNHYFFLGDNRDNSTDSRYFPTGPGYVHENYLVGKANIIFFSTEINNTFNFFEINKKIRFKRFFKKVN